MIHVVFCGAVTHADINLSILGIVVTLFHFLFTFFPVDSLFPRHQHLLGHWRHPLSVCLAYMNTFVFMLASGTASLIHREILFHHGAWRSNLASIQSLGTKLLQL